MCNVSVDVKRNDELDIETIARYDKIILSPGPGLPTETKLMLETLQSYASSKPILGVCLGMQGIFEFFGGRLKNMPEVCHGIQKRIQLDLNATLFQGLQNKQIQVGLYHSWCADSENFPEELKITAISDEGIVMAVEHRSLPIFGVQFHPESIMTDVGFEMIRNFILL